MGTRDRPVEDDDPIFGPFPYPHVWIAARGGDFNDPDRWMLLTDEDHNALATHQRAWQRWRDRESAKERAAHRATLAHPNWENRQRGCIISVPLVSGVGAVMSRKQSPWLRAMKHCNQPCVAFDGTDRRAVGYLYGACHAHLLRALYDDPTREWWWADGSRLDRTSDIEGELALKILARIA